MTKTIAAVPASITRSQYLNLIETVGFNAHQLVSLEFRMDGIYAVVFAYDPDGKPIIEGDGLTCSHKIFIPVVDRPTPADWNAPPDQSATPPTDLR